MTVYLDLVLEALEGETPPADIGLQPHIGPGRVSRVQDGLTIGDFTEVSPQPPSRDQAHESTPILVYITVSDQSPAFGLIRDEILESDPGGRVYRVLIKALQIGLALWPVLREIIPGFGGPVHVQVAHARVKRDPTELALPSGRVAPESSLIKRDFSLENPAVVLEVRRDARVPAEHAIDSPVTLEGINGSLEIFRGHDHGLAG
jgi:hypothetical protein